MLLYISDNNLQTISDCENSLSCVVVKPYEDARMDLKFFSSNQSDIFWLSKDSTTFAMYSVVNEVKFFAKISISEVQ